MDILSLLDPVSLAKTGGLIGVVSIIFLETGFFVGFFFPGDSLLFTAGFLASQGFLNIWLLLPVLFLASVLGNLVGYAFGKKIGKGIYNHPDTFFFKKAHVEKTEEFFKKHGGKTIILARFLPIVRTFTPILAGVAGMEWKLFATHSIIGGALWTLGLTSLGYVLGSTVPDIDKYLLPIILGIIIVSFLPAVFHVLATKLAKR